MPSFPPLSECVRVFNGSVHCQCCSADWTCITCIISPRHLALPHVNAEMWVTHLLNGCVSVAVYKWAFVRVHVYICVIFFLVWSSNLELSYLWSCTLRCGNFCRRLCLVWPDRMGSPSGSRANCNLQWCVIWHRLFYRVRQMRAFRQDTHDPFLDWISQDFYVNTLGLTLLQKFPSNTRIHGPFSKSLWKQLLDH